jgi:hypothetical protein
MTAPRKAAAKPAAKPKAETKAKGAKSTSAENVPSQRAHRARYSKDK